MKRLSLIALASLVVLALVGLLAWETARYRADIRNKTARVREIDVQRKALNKEAHFSHDQEQRQRLIREVQDLSVESRQLKKDLRPIQQKFLELFR
jgi:hypothetical protein